MTCKKALEFVEKALGSASVLRSLDFNWPFVLQTDSSNRGIGAKPNMTIGMNTSLCFAEASYCLKKRVSLDYGKREFSN